MTKVQFAAILSLLACNSVTVPEAEVSAKSYSTVMYSGKNINGPKCTDIQTDVGGLLCSISYEKTSGDLEVKNLSCNEKGCVEVGTESVSRSDYASHSGGISTSEFLMYHMLFNSGRTDYSYSDWHRNTPTYYRSTYHPTYSQKRSASYTPTKSTYSTGLSSKSTTTSKSTSTSRLSTPKTTVKPSTSTSSRSTGFGSRTSSSSSRSSGFRSSSRR